jgi:MSHA pilin protein MshC
MTKGPSTDSERRFDGLRVNGMRRSTMAKPAQCGFSMVELIVVMLVLGLLAAVALPRLTDRSVLQERAARDQLRALIGAARQRAITQAREVCLLAAPAQAQIVYVSGNACNPALPVPAPDGSGAWRVAMPLGVNLGGAMLLRFDNRGRPVPATDATLFVGTLALTVFRETGHVQ